MIRARAARSPGACHDSGGTTPRHRLASFLGLLLALGPGSSCSRTPSSAPALPEAPLRAIDGPPCDVDPAAFRWRWTPGEDLTYEFTLSASAEISGGPLDCVWTLLMRFRTASVDDEGVAEVDLVLERVRLRGSGWIDVDADSSAPAQPISEWDGLVRGVAGRRFRCRIPAAGAPLRWSGLDKVKLAPGPSLTSAIVGKLFQPDMIEALISQGIPSFEGLEGPAGRIWQRKTSVPLILNTARAVDFFDDPRVSPEGVRFRIRSMVGFIWMSEDGPDPGRARQPGTLVWDPVRRRSLLLDRRYSVGFRFEDISQEQVHVSYRATTRLLAP